MAQLEKKQPVLSMVPGILADASHVAGAFRRWGEAIATGRGQTQARWQLLDAASTGGLTVAKLARFLRLARQSVQRTADLLVADGLAQFEPNPDNRRSPRLCLTPRGIELLVKLNRTADAYCKELAEGLRGEELKTASIVLRKFCGQLERDLSADQTGSEYSEVWKNRFRRDS